MWSFSVSSEAREHAGVPKHLDPSSQHCYRLRSAAAARRDASVDVSSSQSNQRVFFQATRHFHDQAYCRRYGGKGESQSLARLHGSSEVFAYDARALLIERKIMIPHTQNGRPQRSRPRCSTPNTPQATSCIGTGCGSPGVPSGRRPLHVIASDFSGRGEGPIYKLEGIHAMQ
jgi:hypothetical protein